MKQSKKNSIIEAILNQIIGFTLIYLAQFIYFKAIGLDVPTKAHFGLMIVSMVISMSKHYAIRRYMEAKNECKD